LASLSSPSLCAPLRRLGPLGRWTLWVLLFCTVSVARGYLFAPSLLPQPPSARSCARGCARRRQPGRCPGVTPLLLSDNYDTLTPGGHPLVMFLMAIVPVTGQVPIPSQPRWGRTATLATEDRATDHGRVSSPPHWCRFRCHLPPPVAAATRRAALSGVSR